MSIYFTNKPTKHFAFVSPIFHYTIKTPSEISHVTYCRDITLCVELKIDKVFQSLFKTAFGQSLSPKVHPTLLYSISCLEQGVTVCLLELHLVEEGKSVVYKMCSFAKLQSTLNVASVR